MRAFLLLSWSLCHMGHEAQNASKVWSGARRARRSSNRMSWSQHTTSTKIGNYPMEVQATIWLAARRWARWLDITSLDDFTPRWMGRASKVSQSVYKGTVATILCREGERHVHTLWSYHLGQVWPLQGLFSGPSRVYYLRQAIFMVVSSDFCTFSYHFVFFCTQLSGNFVEIALVRNCVQNLVSFSDFPVWV